MAKEVSPIIVKYGYRVIVVLFLLFIFSIYLLVEYFLSGRTNNFYLAISIIFFLITLLLFLGFRITIVHKIEKKYFQLDTLIGQTGRVSKGVHSGERGTLNVSNEDWSFICNSDTTDGEIVTVVEVLADQALLKVKKSS